MPRSYYSLQIAKIAELKLVNKSQLLSEKVSFYCLMEERSCIWKKKASAWLQHHSSGPADCVGRRAIVGNGVAAARSVKNNAVFVERGWMQQARTTEAICRAAICQPISTGENGCCGACWLHPSTLEKQSILFDATCGCNCTSDDGASSHAIGGSAEEML